MRNSLCILCALWGVLLVGVDLTSAPVRSDGLAAVSLSGANPYCYNDPRMC